MSWRGYYTGRIQVLTRFSPKVLLFLLRTHPSPPQSRVDKGLANLQVMLQCSCYVNCMLCIYDLRYNRLVSRYICIHVIAQPHYHLSNRNISTRLSPISHTDDATQLLAAFKPHADRFSRGPRQWCRGFRTFR